MQRAVALSGLPPYEAGPSDGPQSTPAPPPTPASPPRSPQRGGDRVVVPTNRPTSSAPAAAPTSPAPGAPAMPPMPAFPPRPVSPAPTADAVPVLAEASLPDVDPDDDPHATQIVAVRPADPPAAPGRSAGERFRPWLVPLVLVGVVAIVAALIGGNRLPDGQFTDDAAGPVPPAGPAVTFITLGPPSSPVASAPGSVTPSGSVTASPSATPTPSVSAGATTPAVPATKAPAQTADPGRGTGKANTSGANLALNRPVSASSYEGEAQWPASAAVDGDTTTRWSSAFSAEPQSITVDLGEVWTISTVEIMWERAHAKSYYVEASGDGSTWTRIYSTTAGAEGQAVISVAKVPGRFVRITGTVRSSEYGYSINEWRVY
ncbi:discoidin domain-containing protein [Catenuloplanes sp. NPDC051500]|uniref:discoidin domain-containing protein n=1 Tax=Catenuloplanes sp. NPDC051500 TaxID=3363959 RepID=UPI0037B7F611